MTPILDRKEFSTMRQEFKRFEEHREAMIQTSRRVIMLSKQVIFSLQRGEQRKAASGVEQMQRLVKKLPDKPYDTNIQRVAKQEYVEAMTFHAFVTRKRIPTAKQLGVEYEEYLLGLCDLSGELSRKAVMDAIKKRYDDARQAHAVVEELYSEFLKFDLRNGELRKKADSIKWNLKRLDDLLYDIRDK